MSSSVMPCSWKMPSCTNLNDLMAAPSSVKLTLLGGIDPIAEIEKGSGTSVNLYPVDQKIKKLPCCCCQAPGSLPCSYLG